MTPCVPCELVSGFHHALDWLYPRICPGCGIVSDRSERMLCWDCARSIEPIQGPVCLRCGEKPAGRVEHDFICGMCRMMNPAFDAARSAARFTGLIRHMLLSFKYASATWLCEDLVDYLEASARMIVESGNLPDAVTAVPLHSSRLRRRGYNQSEELARSLSRRLNRPYHTVLRRIRATPSQTAFRATERWRNVCGAFSATAHDRIFSKRWLIVDDVMTTGATLNEVAAVLRAAGARHVLACTVARGG